MLSIVASLAFKIFPLYITMFLGFFASKFLHVARESIAPIIVYIISPFVVFYLTYNLDINKSVILLPFVFFFICLFISIASLFFAKKIWSDNTKNLIAFTSGTGNIGYFGMPLAFILLSPEAASIYIFTLLVSFFYEYTVGFYIISRGSFTFRQSLARVFKLPVLYAFFVGLTLNLLNVKILPEFITFMEFFKGAYAILGMMMVGMGLSTLKINEIDIKFVFFTIFIKLVFWPIFIIFLIYLDKSFFHFFYKEVYQVLIIAAIVPMAANTVTLATLFKTKPEQAAIAVFLSTIFAFFTIPVFVAIFI